MARRTTGEEIVAIQTQMVQLNSDITEIKGDIKEIKEAIVPTVQDNKHKIENLEKQTNWWKWASPIVAAVFSAVVTFFVLAYFSVV